ncbi:XRE family transcriptional regulator [Streptomyces sp. SID3343]|uniref:helix-turn-helix domain-containing protein n=1 Tax=Streptomyces sp. SID3343 TaxID=2690260 RepID=UPI00136D8293|nr:XRE family transcriptional regulator [Streptomyces sp. SID3343]MYW06638.1 helix-turn-helix domain-containing protein [Streptomyces sp. SID3343]
MTDPAETVGYTLAANLRAARQSRGWRLDELATRSGVSRNMLQQIETCRTNPSIATLARISATLGISIGRLVEPPEELGRVARAADTPTRAAGRASVTRLLINDATPPFTELWDFRLAPDDEIRAAAHPPGTRELLHVHEGTITVEVGGATFTVGPGDALRMRGDRPHTYRNPHPDPVHLTMTVVYAGLPDPRYTDS